MASASAKKNAKRHAAKRAAKAADAEKAVVLAPVVEPETPEQRKIWASQVIEKNIVWYHYAMDCPMQSPYKANLLKKHLESGSLKGTLVDWMKMSNVFTSYYVAGELKGKYITTSYITAEFFDGVDRYVLTRSGSLYKLGQSAASAKTVDGNQGCLSVEEEKKIVHLSFMQWMRLSSKSDRETEHREKHIEELKKLLHDAIDGKA